MTEDEDGRIWVGTMDGLMSFDGHFTTPEQIQFVGRECQDSLPGTNPQVSIQGTEGTTLFQFFVQETIVFVVVTKLFCSLIEAGQANFRCKPQVTVFIFYDGFDYIVIHSFAYAL